MADELKETSTQAPNEETKQGGKQDANEASSSRGSKSDTYESLIEDQKSVQTARENDHFQADSSLSSEN